MADFRAGSENFEANDDDLAIFPAVNAQGYLYEPRARQSEMDSDDYSDEESIGESDNGEVPIESERVVTTDWCECGHFVPQETDEMSTCCHEITPVKQLVDDLDLQCIIQHPGYDGNCLNEYVNETSFYEFLDQNGHVGDDERIEVLYRHVAYRIFPDASHSLFIFEKQQRIQFFSHKLDFSGRSEIKKTDLWQQLTTA